MFAPTISIAAATMLKVYFYAHVWEWDKMIEALSKGNPAGIVADVEDNTLTVVPNMFKLIKIKRMKGEEERYEVEVTITGRPHQFPQEHPTIYSFNRDQLANLFLLIF